MASQVGGDFADTAQGVADRIGIKHEESHGSLERISEFRDWRLLRTRKLTGKRTEALQKLVGPLVERFQYYTMPNSPHEDFSLTPWKPAVGGEAHRLTATVLKELCAGRLHAASIYYRRYISKPPVDVAEIRRPGEGGRPTHYKWQAGL